MTTEELKLKYKTLDFSHYIGKKFFILVRDLKRGLVIFESTLLSADKFDLSDNKDCILKFDNFEVCVQYFSRYYMRYIPRYYSEFFAIYSLKIIKKGEGVKCNGRTCFLLFGDEPINDFVKKIIKDDTENIQKRIKRLERTVQLSNLKIEKNKKELETLQKCDFDKSLFDFKKIKNL